MDCFGNGGFCKIYGFFYILKYYKDVRKIDVFYYGEGRWISFFIDVVLNRKMLLFWSLVYEKKIIFF